MTQSTNPPPSEWQNNVAKALYEAGETQTRQQGFALAKNLWADARLACLPGAEAVVAYLKDLQERSDTQHVKWLTEGVINEKGVWRRAYENEWNKLVCGECDFESPDDPLHTVWLDNKGLEPMEAAMKDFEAVFTVEQRERYRLLSQRMPRVELKE
jgi:hypothetical protein